MTETELFKQAVNLIDEANQEDPNQADAGNGRLMPKELLYSLRMSEMLQRFAPDADELIKIATRAQHIQRWQSHRKDFPMNRQGYLQWRSQLYKFHAQKAAEIMQKVGYDKFSIQRVEKAVGKRGIKVNPDAQLVEDVADLVFIEYYLLGFVNKHPDYKEEKWIDIIRKTWNKMSEKAQRFALSGKVKLPEGLAPLIEKAVS